MLFRAGDEDTICAVSTPPGHGGIAVVRVSGEKALAVTKRLCRFLPEAPESHRLYYGICVSAEGTVTSGGHPSGGQGATSQAGDFNDNAIDEVLVAYFAAGRSFTGEETTEISCHGGEIMTATILKELVLAGARLAQKGEFTYRAFMNGRLDLVQAESVLALIESHSRQSAKVALRQLQGELSHDFARIEDDLVWILAHLEASIDFSTEGIEVVPSQTLTARTTAVRDVVGRLIASYTKGKLLREGLEIAIVGRPNAGKSSLLNAFLREDRAIVTAHAGTTRDTVEGKLTIGGVPVTFIDTAGLRETENEVEKIGIERSRAAMKKADFIFHVIDILDPVEGLGETTPSDHAFYLLNKADLGMGSPEALTQVLIERGAAADRIFTVSAKNRKGLEHIEASLAELVKSIDSDSSNVVTQVRHLELLQKIHSCLETALALIKKDSSPEFIAFELQEAVRAIHELLGKEFNEQVIDRIFKEFCLGK